MTDEQSTTTSAPQPWFAGRRQVTVLLYKVNRRPREQQSLFSTGEQRDVFDHFVEALLIGQPVETGRRYIREWVLGNRAIDVEQRILTGHVGYERQDERSSDHFNHETNEWETVVEEEETTGRAPFVFEADSGIVAVVKHPNFAETTLSYVFTTLLNMGEEAREAPTTVWDVEPLLDEENFLQWLRRADAVHKVTFVAKLPNPDGLEEFEPVYSRLEARRAKALREIMQARNEEVGLQGIEEDRISQAYIAMGSRGYGYVRGEGRRANRATTYDQRERVRRISIHEPPQTWTEMARDVIGVLREFRATRSDVKP